MKEPLVRPKGLIEHVIWYCLTHRLVVCLLLGLVVGGGVLVAPFDWQIHGLVREPVAVDAIPDLGENQQIVLTEWMGRSPRDVDNQITYPLTASLLGVSGIKTVRSYSYFGASYIYLIFEERVPFYDARSRILEKLSSIPAESLPAGVQPKLGPDATGLGQVFQYTLEARDPQGRPCGGWDLHELRTVQDWYVRYALLGAHGVAEVASVGGHIQEYQIDVDPNAMRAHGVRLGDVFEAVRRSNQEIGASNLEVNRVEYFIRGLGYVRSLDDLAYAVVKTANNVPLYVKDIGTVKLGPALRRGVLDNRGHEAVGGTVVARYGENPMATIQSVKKKIAEISAGLPEKVLADGTISKITIVPYYDRSGLIQETLGTLDTAISYQILITMIVILIMLGHMRGSILVSILLPLSVLLTFLAMKFFRVDANIVALSGIAIAIGTLVDMGIILVENNIRHFESAPPDEPAVVTTFRATAQVGGEVLTAMATTIVSFLPVFAMEAAEGKLFKPLAFTKTYALLASILLTIALLPTLTQILLTRRRPAGRIWRPVGSLLMLFAAVWLGAVWSWWLTPLLAGWALYRMWSERIPERWRHRLLQAVNPLAALVVAAVLTHAWLPLGLGRGFWINYLFVTVMMAMTLLFFSAFRWFYPTMLAWALRHRVLFTLAPLAILVWGLATWLGAARILPFPDKMLNRWPLSTLVHTFPGLGREFMPPLDEGSFLYMPTTAGHAAINETSAILQQQNRAFSTIPELDQVVGKLGGDGTAMDPAPISMFETNLSYRSEYAQDIHGRHLRYRFDDEANDLFRDLDGQPVLAPDGKPYTVHGRFERDEKGQLIPDPNGAPFRQWRPALDPDLNQGRAPWDGIRNPDDIWEEIVRLGQVPGTTTAPKLQPIATRMIMLQSGMRAPMGIKVKGPDLATIEAFGIELERLLRQVPSIMSDAVLADRIIGKPYLEFELDRRAMARYNLTIAEVQEVIEVAIGGVQVTTTLEGRERYPVRIRYQRELRDTLAKLEQVILPTPSGAEIPISQIANLNYSPGPNAIKSEDNFLTSYVLFDKREGYAEVDVVEQARDWLDRMVVSSQSQTLEPGQVRMPKGVSYQFAGNYENQVRASRKLMLVLPLALVLIFMILYLQFNRIPTTMLIFSSIAVAWAGGFIMIWLYGQSWFLDFHMFGTSMRDLFQVAPINLSVAVWVGFLALFGIASDDGVLISSYLDQVFERDQPQTVEAIRAATLEAGIWRVRPALMTTATTVIALIPVLTASGRGADIMRPMAIPTFGGMVIEVITILVVPVYYSLFAEWRLARAKRAELEAGSS